MIYLLIDFLIFRNIVVNGACLEKDLKLIYEKLEERKPKDKDVRIEFIEDKSLIALQGPKAKKILQDLVPGNLANLNFMEAAYMQIPNLDEKCLISRCGYTGEDGFEISINNSKATELFDLLLKFEEVKPAGLAARDTLRLEAGLCLYGHDMKETITPIEASLKWLIGKRRLKEGNFPGYEIIKKQITEGVNTKRIGFVIEGNSPARENALIFDKEKTKNIGKVCSGSYSPSLKKCVGMAYVEKEFSKVGTELKVVVRNKDYNMKITKMPFIESKYYKKKSEEEKII